MRQQMMLRWWIVVLVVGTGVNVFSPAMATDAAAAAADDDATTAAAEEDAIMGEPDSIYSEKGRTNVEARHNSRTSQGEDDTNGNNNKHHHYLLDARSRTRNDDPPAHTLSGADGESTTGARPDRPASLSSNSPKISAPSSSSSTTTGHAPRPHGRSLGMDDETMEYDSHNNNDDDDLDLEEVPHVTSRTLQGFKGGEDRSIVVQEQVASSSGGSVGRNKREVHVKTPRYFRRLSPNRVQAELSYYLFSSGYWSERVVLELFYYGASYGSDDVVEDYEMDPLILAMKQKMEGEWGLIDARNWPNEQVDICDWEGITCGWTEQQQQQQINNHMDSYKQPFQQRVVTKIDMMQFDLCGTLPETLSHLRYLDRLNLNSNSIRGSIPTTYGSFQHLTFIDLGINKLTGTIPTELGDLRSTLGELWLEKNTLTGTIPIKYFFSSDDHETNGKLNFLDVSSNQLNGPLHTEMGRLTALGSFFAEDNFLTGTIPTEIGTMREVETIDLSDNIFIGTIPSEVGELHKMIEFLVSRNEMNGTFPVEFMASGKMEVLLLGDNHFTGTLPGGQHRDEGHDVDVVVMEDESEVPNNNARISMRPTQNQTWLNTPNLYSFSIARNEFSGTVPKLLLTGPHKAKFRNLNLQENRFSGTLHSEFGNLLSLERLQLSSNEFTGTIPSEMSSLSTLVGLNITGNRLTGTVPVGMCEHWGKNNPVDAKFGCDAIACPSGTFHPSGAVFQMTECMTCQDDGEHSRYIGSQSCTNKIHMNISRDDEEKPVTSPRDILHLLFISTGGDSWGKSFREWNDVNINECTLPGITCTEGDIAKIDLKDAVLCCSGPECQHDDEGTCSGLPTELAMLSTLQVLDVSNNKFLKGTIPTELGYLTKLKFLSMANCGAISGSIPSELGNLLELKFLDLSSCGLHGPFPETIGNLKLLERLNLSLNAFHSTLPSTIGKLESLRELTISRAHIIGTLPSELGNLRLNHLDMYGNWLSGSIPPSISTPTLRKIDLFNNRLNGTLPESFTNMRDMQILHLKNNLITGTIPTEIGTLENLTWLDISANNLEGTIPTELGSIRSLQNLELAGNTLHGTMPESLCNHPTVNKGKTEKYRCDAIACDIGKFSKTGVSTEESPCIPCPGGETNLYIGSTKCSPFTQRDLLSMLYDVIGGEVWPEKFVETWTDETLPVCEFFGIVCDKYGIVEELLLPLDGIDNDYYESSRSALE
mmetsp:Transcript_24960/g.45184  ORF Transcript_24960/g.45184 Transcript_24960/m.45184 type:complete len:1216 (-) Transcript_24960:628-4275(-)